MINEGQRTTRNDLAYIPTKAQKQITRTAMIKMLARAALLAAFVVIPGALEGSYDG